MRNCKAEQFSSEKWKIYLMLKVTAPEQIVTSTGASEWRKYYAEKQQMKNERNTLPQQMA